MSATEFQYAEGYPCDCNGTFALAAVKSVLLVKGVLPVLPVAEDMIR